MRLIVYSTPTCQMCRFLKETLTKEGIPFETVTDTDVMEKKGITNVPTVEYLGELLTMQQALALIKRLKECEGNAG